MEKWLLMRTSGRWLTTSFKNCFLIQQQSKLSFTMFLWMSHFQEDQRHQPNQGNQPNHLPPLRRRKQRSHPKRNQKLGKRNLPPLRHRRANCLLLLTRMLHWLIIQFTTCLVSRSKISQPLMSKQRSIVFFGNVKWKERSISWNSLQDQPELVNALRLQDCR